MIFDCSILLCVKYSTWWYSTWIYDGWLTQPTWWIQWCQDSIYRWQHRSLASSVPAVIKDKYWHAHTHTCTHVHTRTHTNTYNTHTHIQYTHTHTHTEIISTVSGKCNLLRFPIFTWNKVQRIKQKIYNMNGFEAWKNEDCVIWRVSECIDNNNTIHPNK